MITGVAERRWAERWWGGRRQRLGVWLVAVVVAAEGLVVFRWSDRQRRVAQRLLAELADR